jgi:hypothetical protein
LNRKKESLLDKFLDELNPVNQASAFASKNIDKLETYSLYRRNLLEKSDEEIIALVINSVQKPLWNSNAPLNKVFSNSLKSRQSSIHQAKNVEKCLFKNDTMLFRVKWDVLDCSSGNFYYIIY